MFAAVSIHHPSKSSRTSLSQSPLPLLPFVMQMEKRNPANGARLQRMEAARAVLQRGLSANPHSACLVQAWGLLELQKGNLPAAVKMLDRSVTLDPARNAPVLQWQPVRMARSAVLASATARKRPESTP